MRFSLPSIKCSRLITYHAKAKPRQLRENLTGKIYVRDLEQQLTGLFLPLLQSHFSTRAVDVPAYYPLHVGHSSSRTGGYHRTVSEFECSGDRPTDHI